MCRDQGVLGENALVDFFLVVNGRAGWGEWPGTREGQECTFRALTPLRPIRRPLAASNVECNSRRKARGTRQMAGGGSEGERIRSRELKLEKHGRRDKEKRERGRVDRKNLGKRDALLIVWRTIKREKQRERELIYDLG